MEDIAKEKGASVCLNHIADIFLYEYYIAGENAYQLKPDESYQKHMEDGYQLMDVGEYEKALVEFSAALEDKPVSRETYERIITCYKFMHEVDREFEYTKKSYDYCCTRSEMAAFYRNLGWYYLEMYQPKVAAACYLYSKFFEESTQVENELQFLETALKKDFHEMELSQMQKILEENQIPLKANSVTLALLYKAGMEAKELDLKEQAYECFYMLYDLTQDPEIEQLLGDGGRRMK